MVISNQRLISRPKETWNETKFNLLKRCKEVFLDFILPEQEMVYEADITPFNDSTFQIHCHLLNCSARSRKDSGKVIVGICEFDGKTGKATVNTRHLKCVVKSMDQETYRLTLTSRWSIFKIDTRLRDQGSTSTCREFSVSA